MRCDALRGCCGGLGGGLGFVGQGSRSFRHLGLLMDYRWSVLGLMCSVILVMMFDVVLR